MLTYTQTKDLDKGARLPFVGKAAFLWAEVGRILRQPETPFNKTQIALAVLRLMFLMY